MRIISVTIAIVISCVLMPIKCIAIESTPSGASAGCTQAEMTADQLKAISAQPGISILPNSVGTPGAISISIPVSLGGGYIVGDSSSFESALLKTGIKIANIAANKCVFITDSNAAALMDTAAEKGAMDGAVSAAGISAGTQTVLAVGVAAAVAAVVTVVSSNNTTAVHH